MQNHQKFGFFLLLFGLALFFVILLTILPTHAATGDKLSPTPRDYQRLNACTNASIRPYVKPKDQVKSSIECAAFSKAVSHIESAKWTSIYAKTRRNEYGIMAYKKGKRYIKTYKTLQEGDADFARIYFAYYRGLGYKAFSKKYTGEPHIVKVYTAHLSKWVPEYRQLYSQIAK